MAKKSMHMPKIKIFVTSFFLVKILQTCRVFGHGWSNPSKKIINLEKTFEVYQHAKNQLHLSFFLIHCKDNAYLI